MQGSWKNAGKNAGKIVGEQKPSAVSCVCAAVSKKFKNINGNYHKIETTDPTKHPSHTHTYTYVEILLLLLLLLLLRRNLTGQSFD